MRILALDFTYQLDGIFLLLWSGVLQATDVPCKGQ